MFTKSPKDCFEVMIDLAYILLYEFKKLIPPLLLKVKKQKLIEVIIYNNWRVLLRNSVSSQRLHVGIMFDGRSLSKKG